MHTSGIAQFLRLGESVRLESVIHRQAHGLGNEYPIEFLKLQRRDRNSGPAEGAL